MNALVACHRAHLAWIRTQPQLVIPGVLDEPDPRVPRAGFVEPASKPQRHTVAASPGGGLKTGATEPRRDRSSGLTAIRPVSSALGFPDADHDRPSASVASPESDGTGRRTIPGLRGRCQKGA